MGRLGPAAGTQAAGLIAAAVLVATFALSAVAKAADLGSFSQTLRSLVPAVGPRRAHEAALAAIAAELCLAAWIASGAARPLAAGAATAVLLGFAAIALAVRHRHLRCNCFGTTTTATLGWPTVARNLTLVGAAAVWATVPDLDALGFPAVAIAVVLAIALLVARQMRELAPRFLDLPPPPGTPGITWLDIRN